MKTCSATINIVDSDPEVRHSLQRVLDSDTRRTIAYATGEEFLADFIPEHPSCLILDLYLPGMSGQDILQRLRTENVEIPTIVIAAHVDVATALRAIRLGAVDVCPKPVDPNALLPLVDRALAFDAARARQRQQLSDARKRLARLTPRERQLFELVVECQSYKEMAATLGISTRTVEHHRAHITSKLGMDRLPDMVRLGLVADDGERGFGIAAVEIPHLALQATR